MRFSVSTNSNGPAWYILTLFSRTDTFKEIIFNFVKSTYVLENGMVMYILCEACVRYCVDLYRKFCVVARFIGSSLLVLFVLFNSLGTVQIKSRVAARSCVMNCLQLPCTAHEAECCLDRPPTYICIGGRFCVRCHRKASPTALSGLWTSHSTNSRNSVCRTLAD